LHKETDRRGLQQKFTENDDDDDGDNNNLPKQIYFHIVHGGRNNSCKFKQTFHFQRFLHDIDR